METSPPGTNVLDDGAGVVAVAERDVERAVGRSSGVRKRDFAAARS